MFHTVDNSHRAIPELAYFKHIESLKLRLEILKNDFDADIQIKKKKKKDTIE